MNGMNDDEIQRLRRRRQARQTAYGRERYAGQEAAGRRQMRPEDRELDEAYYYEEEYGFDSRDASGSYGGYEGEPKAASAKPRTYRRTASAAGTSSGRQSRAEGGRTEGSRGSRSAGSRNFGGQGARSGQNPAGTGGQSSGRRRRRKNGFLKYILAVLLLCAAVGGAWMFFNRPTGHWTVAVFGLDSRDGNTDNALADVQMICSIDRATGEIKLVSVYRDTYLKIDSEGTYHKINEAYFKGGHEQALYALEENLDLDIDDYAAFNWKTVAEAINVLGGIDLEITNA